MSDALQIGVFHALVELRGKVEGGRGKTQALMSGICSGVAHYTSAWNRELDEYWRVTREQAFKAWKHYSGDPGFPIPDPSGEREAAGVYWNCDYTDRLMSYHWKGEYGALRFELLDYLIEWYRPEGTV